MERFSFPDGIPFGNENRDGREMFVFKPDNMDKWHRFERMLRKIVECVHSIYPSNSKVIPPTPPSAFGYDKAYKTYEELCRRVSISERAFQLYVAWTIYVVVTCADHGSIRDGLTQTGITWPKWAQKGFDSSWFTPDWLHGFFFSPAFDFRQIRVGTLMLPQSCTFLEDIPLFLRARVPFTIVWPDDAAGEGLLASASLSDDVKNALRVSESDSYKAIKPTEIECAGSGWGSGSGVGNWSNWTKPDSRRTYDHWLPFFVERDTKNLEKLKKASQSDRNTYLQRRSTARDVFNNAKCPSGSKVMLWERYDKDPTRWVRFQIENQEKSEKWTTHGANEKVFDEVSKVWDLCSDMGKELPEPARICRAPLSDEDEDEDEDDMPMDKSPVPDELLRPYLRHPLWLKQYSMPPKEERRSPPRHPKALAPRMPHASSSRRSITPQLGPSRSSEWRPTSHVRDSQRSCRSYPFDRRTRRSPSPRRGPGPSRQREFDRASRPRSPSWPEQRVPVDSSDALASPLPPPPPPPPPPPLSLLPLSRLLSPPLAPALQEKSADENTEPVREDDVISLDEEHLPDEVTDPSQIHDQMAVDEPVNVPLPDVEMEESDPTPVAQEAAPGPAEATRPWFDPFMEYMYFRYGFTFPPEGPPYPNLPSWQAPPAQEVISTLRPKVFDAVSPLDVTEDLPRHLFHFVELLHTEGGPPASLWDLHPMNERRLVRAGTRVSVDVVAVAPECNVYRLRVGHQQEAWSLYVGDPTVAVECLRREFVVTRDIATLFLRRGTPFALAFNGDRPNAPPPPPVLTRPPGFSHAQEHFVEWENAARDFMQTPRSRLVWKVGGLFWRLALFFVGTMEPALALLDATPSTTTRYITPTAYEETLTEVEMDLILGMYRIRSGTSLFACSLAIVPNCEKIKQHSFLPRTCPTGLIQDSSKVLSLMQAVGLHHVKPGSLRA